MSDSDNKQIFITKVTKRGFSRAVGSAFGFGSWTVGETSFEIEVNPPIDLTTKEGQERYKKLKDTLSKMSLRALEEDVTLLSEHSPEFKASVEKRASLVQNALEGEE